MLGYLSAMPSLIASHFSHTCLQENLSKCATGVSRCTLHKVAKASDLCSSPRRSLFGSTSLIVTLSIAVRVFGPFVIGQASCCGEWLGAVVTKIPHTGQGLKAIHSTLEQMACRFTLSREVASALPTYIANLIQTVGPLYVLGSLGSYSKVQDT